MAFRPILDRILLRKIEEKQSGKVVIPDQYSESNKFEVVALGDGLFLGGTFMPAQEILSVGDIVLVGQYNLEACDIDGEKLFLSRIQDVRGKQSVATRARAAA